MSLKRDVHCQELGVKKTGVGEVRRSMKLSPATLGWLLVFLIAGMNPVLLGAQSNASPFVEIGFNSAPASAFYSELTVRESSEGTAYAACGFSHGWLGVQELVGGKKAVVFSVSSMPKSKKHAAAAVRDTQVRVANLGEGVRERVFADQSTVELSYDLDWAIGESLRFIVYSQTENTETRYAAYCYLMKENRWLHLGTCSLDSGGSLLLGLHSFIGDKSADKLPGQQPRRCDVESPWILVGEKWMPTESASTSNNVNPVAGIMVGVEGGRFVLRTEPGSKTTGVIGDSEIRLSKAERKPPLDLPVPMGDGEMGRRRFRILAYNIKHGRGNDNQVDLARTAEVIRRLHPDFVALQEVDQKVQRSGGIDQPSKLALLTGLQHHAFGSFFDYQGGQYGMAVLSRNPLARVKNLRLPDGSEPRTSLVVDVKLDSKKQLKIADVHFYRTEKERLAQARRLLEFLDGDQSDIAIVGDFNSKPESPVIKLFQSNWEIPDKGTDHFTFRSDRPEVEIDYALLNKDAGWSISEIDVIEEPVVSDHRPLVLEIVEDK